MKKTLVLGVLRTFFVIAVLFAAVIVFPQGPVKANGAKAVGSETWDQVYATTVPATPEQLKKINQIFSNLDSAKFLGETSLYIFWKPTGAAPDMSFLEGAYLETAALDGQGNLVGGRKTSPSLVEIRHKEGARAFIVPFVFGENCTRVRLTFILKPSSSEEKPTKVQLILPVSTS
jgi:hypothetical protein